MHFRMSGVLLIVCSALLGSSLGRKLVFKNRSTNTIWVGSQGNPGHQPINNGGWVMGPKSIMSFDVPDNHAGRVWGRTGCQANGHCETGDCGNRLQCNGAGGVPPVTLAEYTFKGYGGLDFYDISLVDGYNVPMSMAPMSKKGSGSGLKYSCTACSCSKKLNSICPAELKQMVGGRVVACNSACNKFNTDQYCCRGRHNQPHTCQSRHWPKNYPKFFKDNCPQAYSYAYDDLKSTFTCDDKAGYQITLG